MRKDPFMGFIHSAGSSLPTYSSLSSSAFSWFRKANDTRLTECITGHLPHRVSLRKLPKSLE